MEGGIKGLNDKLKGGKTMEKFLLTIEFRYHGMPKFEEGGTARTSISAAGVYDDFNEACKEGNSLLENLENRFPLHVFPNGKGVAKKERFSKNGGCFGSKKDLISNLAYLTTPFDFYAKITTLKYDAIDSVVDEVIDSIKKYRVYKAEN